jgi:hypothetical protein
MPVYNICLALHGIEKKRNKTDAIIPSHVLLGLLSCRVLLVLGTACRPLEYHAVYLNVSDTLEKLNSPGLFLVVFFMKYFLTVLQYDGDSATVR